MCLLQVHGQLVMKGQAAITAGKAAAGEPDGAAAAAAAGEPEEDDDIFGEAGTEYVPEIPKKKGAEGDARWVGGVDLTPSAYKIPLCMAQTGTWLLVLHGSPCEFLVCGTLCLTTQVQSASWVYDCSPGQTAVV